VRLNCALGAASLPASRAATCDSAVWESGGSFVISRRETRRTFVRLRRYPAGGMATGDTATRDTVLVVDDSDAIRLLCRVNLELDGHRVLESATLQGARELLDREPVDVVLLDISVGADDGRELLEELRRTRPGIAVAMLTGSVDTRSLLHSGAHAVVVKPFHLEELKRTVDELVGRAAASR